MGAGKRVVGGKVAGREGKKFWGGKGIGAGEGSWTSRRGVAAGKRVVGGRRIGAGKGFERGRVV